MQKENNKPMIQTTQSQTNKQQAIVKPEIESNVILWSIKCAHTDKELSKEDSKREALEYCRDNGIEIVDVMG